MTGITMTARATSRRRGALAALWVGMALTVAVTVYSFFDATATNVLADHISASYPAYTADEIDAAVWAYLAILTVIGALGVMGWAGTLLLARRGRSGAGWLASGLLVIGFLAAISGLSITDTSGDVGLAPLLGWLQLLPCVAGLAAVVLLWRRPR